MTDIEVLIKNLKMVAHPEGGHFSESFRDESNNVSLIYYMLQKNEWSHWHRLTKNEILKESLFFSMYLRTILSFSWYEKLKMVSFWELPESGSVSSETDPDFAK